MINEKDKRTGESEGGCGFKIFVSDESWLRKVTVGGLKCRMMLACLTGGLCSRKGPHSDTIN